MATQENPEEIDRIIERLKRLRSACEVLSDEIRDIRDRAKSQGVKWPTSTDAILAHLSLDMSYLKAEINDLLT